MDKKLKIRDWLLELPKRGKITFSTDDIFRQNPAWTKDAVASSLKRLVKNGKIQSVWHGFYVVVPVEYELKGIVPPVVYIDRLMAYLQRNYYIGLLNAATFYGAAHQQPQEFTVITGAKNLRDKQKNGVKINFVAKKDFLPDFIQKHTTKTGNVSVSSPELTAFDLLFYQKEIGGLSRAGTVLNELIDEMDFDKITPVLLQAFPSTVIQRFGYLLDEILEQ
ncbi:MAG: type IV toxin-antitoxin system AbiEi family antitoxin, partial [Dysgonamonadaceae bacterium]|nr:type IV toxin-antitoxin system AbiEi family antitoxin [Dysgonamonadaceae bacterium]